MQRLKQPVDIETIVADSNSFAITGAIRFRDQHYLPVEGYSFDITHLEVKPEGCTDYLPIEGLVNGERISSSRGIREYRCLLQRTEEGQPVSYLIDHGILNLGIFGPPESSLGIHQLSLGKAIPEFPDNRQFHNPMSLSGRLAVFQERYGAIAPDEKVSLIFQRV
ncbi:MAG: hypothetical protein WCV90_00185 [Candidatus Woesearchaeota archaeon]